MDVKAAEAACEIAHAGQFDKGGNPYYEHPMAVASAVDRLGEDFEVVALLHDVLEDTDYELDPTEFTGLQWLALQAITRQPDEPYQEFIIRCRRNFVARVVKVADIRHNLRSDRINCLGPEDQLRLKKKYELALDVLMCEPPEVSLS